MATGEKALLDAEERATKARLGHTVGRLSGDAKRAATLHPLLTLGAGALGTTTLWVLRPGGRTRRALKLGWILRPLRSAITIVAVRAMSSPAVVSQNETVAAGLEAADPLP